MNSIELMTRLEKGENLHSEFKEWPIHPDDLASSIIAFANTDGGQIFLGVDDDGQIAGWKLLIRLSAIKEKQMKTIRYLWMTTFLITVIFGCSHLQENKDVLFQTSTINALLEGIYDGEITYKELKQHGDFGIGTFNSLDGEMIGLDGKFYQIKADGIAYPVDNSSLKAPFAVVTFFESDKSALLNQGLEYNQLTQYVTTRILLVISRPYGEKDIPLGTVARPMLEALCELAARF